MSYRSYLPHVNNSNNNAYRTATVVQTVTTIPYTDPKSAFMVYPANTWLETSTQQGATNRLFGSFWFEDELSIYLPIPTWANLFWPYKLGKASVRASLLVHLK